MSLDIAILQSSNPAISAGAVLVSQESEPKLSAKAAAKDIDQWTDCLLAVQSARDTLAFARLFEHFAPRAKAFLIKSGADAAQAEETTQEALAIVWHKADQFDPTRASASTWIYTIVRNKQIDVIRKQRRPEPDELPWGMDAPQDPAEAVEMSEEATRLRLAIQDLPERQKDIVKQAYYGDLSHKEIAELTGLPLGTIKSHIRLALDRLRHDMMSSVK